MVISINQRTCKYSDMINGLKNVLTISSLDDCWLKLQYSVITWELLLSICIQLAKEEMLDTIIECRLNVIAAGMSKYLILCIWHISWFLWNLIFSCTWKMTFNSFVFFFHNRHINQHFKITREFFHFHQTFRNKMNKQNNITWQIL